MNKDMVSMEQHKGELMIVRIGGLLMFAGGIALGIGIGLNL